MNRQVFSFTFLALFAFVGVARPAEPLKHLHVLMVLDTRDEDLKDTLVHDKNNLYKLLKTGIPQDRYTLTIFEGGDATPAKILEYYKDLKKKAKPDEGILFYVSCHGGTWKEDGEHVIALTGAGKKQFMDRKDLRQAMLDVKAGLAVLLTDCCSDHISRAQLQSRGPAAKNATTEIQPAFRRLFFEERGLVDITASMTGFYAWSDNENGGIFTRTIYNVLLREIKNDAIDWRTFYQKIKAETEVCFDDFKKAEIKASRAANTEPHPLLVKQQAQTPMIFAVPGVVIGLGVGDDPKGVRVVEVQQKSRAAKAGFEKDDLIVAIEGKTFRDRSAYSQLVDELLKSGKTQLKFDVIDAKGQRTARTVSLAGQ
jgi:hypothetical protein